MKLCKTCNESLPLEKFEKARKECKSCRRQKRKLKHKMICKFCKKEFFSDKTGAEYCSHTCHSQSRKTFELVNCSYCNIEKKVVPSLYKRLENFYCNNTCRANHLKVLMAGESNPNYTKEIINCSGCSILIKVAPHRIKKHSYQFCSFECYKENIGKYFRGENNPQWNNSLSYQDRIKSRSLFEYSDWRFKVYQRDNYSCKCCGDNAGGNLNAHHLDGWDKHIDVRFDVNNGITLCSNCHFDFHSIYGFGNNTKQQFEEYIEDLQKRPV